MLIGLIMALTDDGNGVPKGPLAPLLIGLLVAVIGAATAPLTGFAMNPARDFGPKLFTFLNGWGSVAMTGGREIPYFLVPLIAPVIGGIRRGYLPLRYRAPSPRRQTRRGDGESSAVLIDPTCAHSASATHCGGVRRKRPFRLVSPALPPQSTPSDS